MSELKKAAALSYVNIILRNIVGIFLTPFIIGMLGKGDYGLYSLIGSFIAYLTILDFGLNSTIVRYISQYRTEKDKISEGNFIANVLIVYVFLAFIIAMCGLVLFWNSDNLFSKSLNVNELEKGKTMILILIFNVIVTIPGKALEGISIGYKKFIFPRLIAIIKYLSRTILVLAILTEGADSLGLVILDTILNLVFIAITLYYVFFVLKAIPKLQSFNLDFLKEIFGYSIWVFVFALVFQFKWSTAQVMIGMNTSPEVVAVFAVGITLGMYFNTFGNVINGLLLPRVVKNVYEGMTHEEHTEQSIQIGRLTLFILSFILLAFLLFGNEFIFLWLGKDFEESWLVALLFMIGYFITLVQDYFHKILEAKKMLKFKSLSFLIFAFFGILFGTRLVEDYEMKGMLVGIVTFELFLQVFLNIYYQRVLKIPILYFFKKTFLSYAINSILLFLLINFFKKYYLEVSWLSFLIQTTIYSILFIVTVYSFVFTKYEKDLVNKILKRKIE